MTDQKHTASQLRGMITSRQRELEEIATRCAQAGYDSAAEHVTEACAHLVRARTKIARLEGKDNPL